MWVFGATPKRLSLRHGATPEDIRRHMAELFDELEATRFEGLPISQNGWRRRTAGLPSLQERYLLGRELGKGHFGAVRACTDIWTGETFACKTILKSKITRSEDLRELRAEVLIPLLLQQHDEDDDDAAASSGTASLSLLDLWRHHVGTSGPLTFRSRRSSPSTSSGSSADGSSNAFNRSNSSDSSMSNGSSIRSISPTDNSVIAQALSETGVIRLFEVFEDESALHLVLELCAGGDLFELIARRQRLSERDTARIFRQVVEAAQRMHERGVVHRDLKPENILLIPKTRAPPQQQQRLKPDATCTSASGNEAEEEAQAVMDEEAGAGAESSCFVVRVADFGLAHQLRRGERLRGMAGSPFYMAPEIVRGKEYREQVDVWSLGVVLYTCLAGGLPFYGKNHNAVFAASCKADPDMSSAPWPLVSAEAKQLIRKMLQADPERRIRMHEVLHHPWVRAVETGQCRSECRPQPAAAAAAAAAAGRAATAGAGGAAVLLHAHAHVHDEPLPPPCQVLLQVNATPPISIPKAHQALLQQQQLRQQQEQQGQKKQPALVKGHVHVHQQKEQQQQKVWHSLLLPQACESEQPLTRPPWLAMDQKQAEWGKAICQEEHAGDAGRREHRAGEAAAAEEVAVEEGGQGREEKAGSTMEEESASSDYVSLCHVSSKTCFASTTASSFEASSLPPLEPSFEASSSPPLGPAPPSSSVSPASSTSPLSPCLSSSTSSLYSLGGELVTGELVAGYVVTSKLVTSRLITAMLSMSSSSSSISSNTRATCYSEVTAPAALTSPVFPAPSPLTPASSPTAAPAAPSSALAASAAESAAPSSAPAAHAAAPAAPSSAPAALAAAPAAPASASPPSAVSAAVCAAAELAAAPSVPSHLPSPWLFTSAGPPVICSNSPDPAKLCDSPDPAKLCDSPDPAKLCQTSYASLVERISNWLAWRVENNEGGNGDPGSRSRSSFRSNGNSSSNNNSSNDSNRNGNINIGRSPDVRSSQSGAWWISTHSSSASQALPYAFASPLRVATRQGLARQSPIQTAIMRRGMA